MLRPQEEPVVPAQDLINQALDHRAELVESRIDLNSRDLSGKAVRNAMLPTLDAFAYYGGSGVGGSVNPAIPNCASTTSNFCFNPAKAPPPFQTSNTVGYGGTLNQLVNSTAPEDWPGVEYSVTQSRSASQPGALAIGIPPGSGAFAPARESGAHRSA